MNKMSVRNQTLGEIIFSLTDHSKELQMKYADLPDDVAFTVEQMGNIDKSLSQRIYNMNKLIRLCSQITKDVENK